MAIRTADYNQLMREREMAAMQAEYDQRSFLQGLGGLAAQSGIYGQAQSYASNPFSEAGYEKEIEKTKKPTKSTLRTELQAETDEWLKDVL